MVESVIQIRCEKMVKCWCECNKKHHICEKGYIWNPATCSCKNGKYQVKFIKYY